MAVQRMEHVGIVVDDIAVQSRRNTAKPAFLLAIALTASACATAPGGVEPVAAPPACSMLDRAVNDD